MKLMFVCKRSPQQRDLMRRPYGRFHHLPTALAAQGHEVSTLLVGHAGAAPERDHRDGVERVALDLRSEGPARAWRRMRAEASAFRPDWIIGCSDAWAGWLAHRLARRCEARLALDAYDNFESYMPWNLPLHALWRRALAAAQLVTAAGPQLARRLDQHRAGGPPTQVLPMAADPGFVPADRQECRERLGLAGAGPVFGYYGGWGSARGTGLLAEAFHRVRQARPDARLLVSGKPPPALGGLPGVQALGYLADEDMPRLVAALDLAFILTADTAFGRYSYPAKLCEAMACRRPLAATATEPVRWMLGGDERFLAPVGDAAALAERALAACGLGDWDYGELPGWDTGAALLSGWLQSH